MGNKARAEITKLRYMQRQVTNRLMHAINIMREEDTQRALEYANDLETFVDKTFGPSPCA